MNYYEHHLGDYAKDTTSLSMLEEGAYRRLIDVYYAKEQPLPPDLVKVCKAARAMSKPEKDAVLAVLEEFFTLTPEGYRHKRCDEEIERYQASQEDAVDKRENDKDRQRRARERRKALFQQLREHGIVPPWDTKTHELEAHLSRVTKQTHSKPVTRDDIPPVTRDNTATQTPVTSSQSPENTFTGAASAPPAAAKPDRKATPANPATDAVWQAYREAYFARYAAQPARNKTVNSQIKQFVERLGADAPAVAANYVRSNNAFAVKMAHSVALMLSQYERWHLNWQTGKDNEQTDQPRQSARAQAMAKAVPGLAARTTPANIIDTEARNVATALG